MGNGGGEDITKYQKVSLSVFTISGLALIFTWMLSAGGVYIQFGIKNNLLSYYEINIILVSLLVITGMSCLGIVMKVKPIRVVLNVLIVIGLILYFLYSFIVWVDTDYTEFYSESGEERFLAIERDRGSDIYQVRGSVFIHRIGEIEVGDEVKPVKRNIDSIIWYEPNKMVMIDFYGNSVEMYYK